jgi:hypothetical protein
MFDNAMSETLGKNLEILQLPVEVSWRARALLLNVLTATESSLFRVLIVCILPYILRLPQVSYLLESWT